MAAALNWTPWRFSSPELEREYAEDRAHSWMRLDRTVVVPWTLLFVSIIKKHWHALPWPVLFKSFSCFIVIICPSYLQLVLGSERYRRHRLLIVILAKSAYVFHAGGGLYRDGLMSVGNTAAEAANLFVRLLVGSRTCFWLVLAFGYTLPPALEVPMDALHVGLMMWLKPSRPFCSVMQSAASMPLFRTIAHALPLVSLMPLGRPQLEPGADVCNPLVSWMMIGIGYLLPVLANVCADIVARRRFAARRVDALPPDEAVRWVPGKRSSAWSPWAIMALIYPHTLTALWYCLMWHQLEFPRGPAGAAAAAAAAAAQQQPQACPNPLGNAASVGAG